MTSTTATAGGRRPQRDRPAAGRRALLWAGRRPLRALLILLVVVLLVSAVLPVAIAVMPLLQGRAAMHEARAALAGADPQAALPHLRRAETRFRVGRYALRNPLTTPTGLVPGLYQNIHTAGALAAAGELTAGAARTVTEAVEELGGLPALAPRDGAVPLEPIARLAPVAERAAADLAEAERLVGGSPTLLLAPPLAEARLELLTELEVVRPQAEGAAALAAVLPAFLGADEPKRYLLGASNPAELRGSGGLIGAYAVVEAVDGRLAFGEFVPTPDIEPVDPTEIEPPTADYAARYDRFGSGGFFLNINMTPDFPSAAIAMTRLHTHVTGESVDGIIVADPHVFAALLAAGGPVEVPGGRTLAAGDVVAYVASEAYGDFDSDEERKRVLGTVAAAAVQRLLAPGADADLAQMVEALGRAAGDGHLLVYADDPEVQAALETAGVDGGLPAAEGDILAVAVNNASNNKVDFWLERHLRYDVELAREGRATGNVALELHNGAPTAGYPTHVLGASAEGLEPGDARPIVSLFCGPRCATEGLQVDGQEADPLVEEELGLPVLTVQERLPAGATLRIDARRDIRDAWLEHRDGDAGWYRLTLDAQTALQPARVELSVTIPDGFEVARAPRDMTIDGRTVTFSGELNGDAAFDVHFTRPAGDRLRRALRELLP